MKKASSYMILWRTRNNFAHITSRLEVLKHKDESVEFELEKGVQRFFGSSVYCDRIVVGLGSETHGWRADRWTSRSSGSDASPGLTLFSSALLSCP